jgi:hypothetical protein
MRSLVAQSLSVLTAQPLLDNSGGKPLRLAARNGEARGSRPSFADGTNRSATKRVASVVIKWHVHIGCLR